MDSGSTSYGLIVCQWLHSDNFILKKIISDNVIFHFEENNCGQMYPCNLKSKVLCCSCEDIKNINVKIFKLGSQTFLKFCL